ncbi:NAD-glutamate dehydrogenase domain-containing protein [Sphingomonas montana]|uniref:NAD-glutamate dehydrogenase domain-containing protein n=1 Tax=Sphingomonas montana TaxID=1843236 RepID=UPI00096E15EC|nr:NAD-glutamate dehydrogenase domain-containing protein [Sphingomonas montana]
MSIQPEPTTSVESQRDAIAAALVGGALPGETDGFDSDARLSAASFVAEVAARRLPGEAVVRIESAGSDAGRRRMRLVTVNADMPFLVDSIAGAVAARGLAVHRLLHPVVSVRRDSDGVLDAILPPGTAGERRESIVYMEIERADARDRRGIEDEIRAVLADVRAAVQDWPKLQVALRDEGERMPDGEGAALLRWLLDRHFTLLGAAVETQDGIISDPLGILRIAPRIIWNDADRRSAIAHFEGGGEAPLVLKSDSIATVHRRAPLDLIVVPVRDGGRVVALSIHVGLWTSSALRAPSDKVPVLRARLSALEEKYGFDPAGHAGKALRHALSALPHDLLTGLDRSSLERVALTAMSLADRPRPKLVLVTTPLRRHVVAFVWLPRDELTTQRRVAVTDMIASAVGSPPVNWSLDLDDGDLALLRLTFASTEAGLVPDDAALDTQLETMLRGWAPAIESSLAASEGASRGARLAITYANAFPIGYRNRTDPAEGAVDILRMAALAGPDARDVRISRRDGEPASALHLKTYRIGGMIPLSDAVPVLENFGFRVLGETATALDEGRAGYIHDFLLDVGSGEIAERIARDAEVAETAIAAVLESRAENDEFNTLIVAVGLPPRAVVLLRAWFRYLRQTGLSYGLATVVEALKRAPQAATGLIALFDALHDPAGSGDADAAAAAIDAALANVGAIDDDRILRRIRAVIQATLRTNAFSPAADEALAFKLESRLIPGLPAPVPWREIWVYSPRIEGIHLRGGPIARGGLRWSDRRDDFRTEILGLMKAQVVKNAVIVPTGAKGGFYPKALPAPGDRDAWLAEGTESYRIFIRSLLSVTDNIVDGAVVHPDGVTIRDGDDPYFVVAADKGTATFSDVANAIAVDHGFWLGDAFASGGSQGYDHKAMGITAKGAWVSVQRHFAEHGVDVQTDPIIVVGCGDMSGDVFGNGMLLSKTLKLVAAFDHRHIFLDPDPDPAASWTERARLFQLPRSSWADYDTALISPGGGIFPRSQKAIPLSPAVRAVLDVTEETLDPAALIAAILKAPADLLWFGGIGTYVKAASESNAEVGDPANDANRVDAERLRVKAIGEGANLGLTQAGRIAFAARGGRINTDFIDNSAGVDCSDNEVNIKIALNREMNEGRLGFDDRNAFLASMTDDVAAIVLEDNRLQTLALSLAERGGAAALPSYVRVIETLESMGRLDRAVEGLGGNEDLLRRAQDDHGLTRPELAVLLSHGKLALQARIEKANFAQDPALRPLLHAAFPKAMRDRFADAIDQHRLRPEIIATKMANRVVNRLGIVIPFELAEEEGVSIAQVAAAYFAADAIFGFEEVWHRIETEPLAEDARLMLFRVMAGIARLHLADLIRIAATETGPGPMIERLSPGIGRLDAAVEALLRDEARSQSAALRALIGGYGADPALIDRIVRLAELDGAIGTATLAADTGVDEVSATGAYVRLGEALGLDWAKSAAIRFVATDPWERLLTAGLARDFEQLRLDFLERQRNPNPLALVDGWLDTHRNRVLQFRALIDRARAAPVPTAAMLAQIAGQARVLLAR